MTATIPMVPLISEADKNYGYAFGCEGLADYEEARRMLANCSEDTIRRLANDGELRKGQMPGRRTAGICRRSIREYMAKMES